MAETQSRPRLVRFGVFEADVRTGELRKDGVKLKFSGQPFQVLAILLERPGDVVSREELQKRLWPDTFVDVERNLNTAVNKIREVLGDSAENPRYVETLPRRGYRFIGEIEHPPAAASSHSNGEMDSGHEALETASQPPAKTDPPPQPKTPQKGSPKRFRWWVPAVAVLTLVLASLGWYVLRPLPPPRVTEYTQITDDGRHKDVVGTDGARLYLDIDHQSQHIGQVAISGGEIRSIPVPLPNAWMTDLSPDGSTLLFTEGEGLWSLNVPGGSLRHLTDGLVADGTWSPDGNSVAYSTPNGEIDVVRSDGTGGHRLIDMQGQPVTSGCGPGWVAWSPDGSRIRFSRNNKFWEMSSDGSGLHPLLPGWRPSSWQCSGRWTPDGKFFVFLSPDPLSSSYPTIPASQMWALDERHRPLRRARTEPVQLTSGPIRWSLPIPSKDGKKIFARGVILRGELVRFDAVLRQLKPHFGGISAEQVSFSSDGKFVAYVTFPEGILWKANRDGSDPVQLTDPPLYPKFPVWSPDGAKILFLYTTPEGHTQGYVIPSQGGSPRPLVPEDPEDQVDPNWSPDGRRIVFASFENSVTRILDLASHQITTVPGSANMSSPRWSPDGRFIAALRDPADDLTVFDFKTQRWSVLMKGENGYPTWSRDGRFIYFLRPVDDPGVYRIRPSGGKAECVVDLKGFHYTGIFVYWFGLDPDDTPMLLRDAGTDDIFALTLEEK